MINSSRAALGRLTPPHPSNWPVRPFERRGSGCLTNRVTFLRAFVTFLTRRNLFRSRWNCPASCSGGRRPLIAGCLSLQRLGIDIPSCALFCSLEVAFAKLPVSVNKSFHIVQALALQSSSRCSYPPPDLVL